MDDRRSLHCEAMANDSSTTHFLVGITSVSVIVRSGVVSTQPPANEFAGVEDKNKRKSTSGVFIFVSLRDFLIYLHCPSRQTNRCAGHHAASGIEMAYTKSLRP